MQISVSIKNKLSDLGLSFKRAYRQVERFTEQWGSASRL